MKSLTLSQAIEGFLLEKEGQRLSPNTIAEYKVSFRKLQKYLGDPDFATLTLDEMRGFMVELAEPCEPAGIAPRPAKVLLNETVLNIHTALSALWTWAAREGLHHAGNAL